MLLKEDYAKIISYVFNTLLVVYLILLLLNQLFTAFNTNNILSLNYLLIIVIIFGILFVFTNKEEKLEKDEALKIRKGRKKEVREYKMESYSEILGKNYNWLVYALGILGFLIIKLKTYTLGWLSWVISITAGILIILLSLLVLEEDDD